MKDHPRDWPDERRPTPEQMLQRAQAEDTSRAGGRLRMFLGAAPGVGKTYQMLEEGRRLRDLGHDVVVGLVETYGRAETEAQLDDLEVVPRQQILYRGVQLEEMDTGAVLARNPDIALVDEFAHTNVPGSAREKRYEDVKILLDAGIDVLSTMNVQHLESVNDLVQSITGIQVRETVPDSILDAAEVELVDLAPARLRERLAAGKVYPEERARRAMANFFSEENLTALRELALRRTAEGVEAMLEGYMRGDADPWPTVERVVAAIHHHADAEVILRHAWRIARGLHADLVAVTVLERPLDQIAEFQRQAILRHQELAADLGAEVITVVGLDAADTLIQTVRTQRATDLVVGRPGRSRWRFLGHSTLLDQLVQHLDNVDIHIVSRRLTN